MANLMEIAAQNESRIAKAFWETDFDADIQRAMAGIIYNRDTLDAITERTAKAVGVTPEQIRGNRAIRIYARARHFVMWKARQAGYSVIEVAEYFGCDNSSISHACQKIKRKLGQ